MLANKIWLMIDWLIDWLIDQWIKVGIQPFTLYWYFLLQVHKAIKDLDLDLDAELEMCMGMGFPMGPVLPWEFIPKGSMLRWAY